MDPPRSGVLNKGREYGSIVTAANLENCRLSGDATGSMPTCVHLISYLASTFKHSSQDEWHQKVADGLVEVNGTTCTDEKAAVYVGDSITYQRPPWVEPYFENGGKLPNHLPILFEDQDIVAVHKPSGLPVMPSTVFNECTVMAVLKRQFSKESRDAPRVRTTGSCEGAAISGQIKSSSTTIGTQNCIAPQLRQKRKINTTSPIAGDAQSSQIANSAPPATAVCSKRQRHHDVAGGGAKASQEAPCSSGTTIPSPAHRLGVGTSGVLLCGKTSVGRKMLGGLFDCSGLDEGTANFRKLKPKTLAKIRKKAVARMKKVQKVYLALCEGVIQVRACTDLLTRPTVHMGAFLFSGNCHRQLSPILLPTRIHILDILVVYLHNVATARVVMRVKSKSFSPLVLLGTHFHWAVCTLQTVQGALPNRL